ncbi:MAG: hypothetical protein S4CHLAM7_10870 [Chlamydiae bacterium]|nr:hypothetical protein [Chlamydiota bacterium]
MNKVNKFLSQRLKKAEKSSKMSTLATQSMEGHLTSFSGIFGFTDLNANEKDLLSQILKKFSNGETELDVDLKSLITLTSEVKAINNQALILHGERIKAAQTILKKYKDGAFTAWLISTYGNRQTPYNFLQYYEFYLTMPQTLRPMIELLPKQAVYTLASRDGAIEDKQIIIENYSGESKSELIKMIRETFPVSDKDKRKKSIGIGILNSAEKVRQSVKSNLTQLSDKQKNTLKTLLNEILGLME